MIENIPLKAHVSALPFMRTIKEPKSNMSLNRFHANIVTAWNKDTLTGTRLEYLLYFPKNQISVNVTITISVEYGSYSNQCFSVFLVEEL